MSEPRVSNDAPSGGDEPAPQAPAPYQNLWVPLVVIPAGIVIAIVLVFSLFGLISGREASLADNLERVVHGGTNERTQALWNIARQVDENELALREGREPPWPMEEGFADRVHAALVRLGEDSHEARLTLAVLLSTLGDERGVQDLIGLLALDEEQDPGGKLRFAAAVNLGKIGDPRAREHVLPLLGSEDEGLRAVAAYSLQWLPGPGVEEGLTGALGDPSLLVRGNAALALARIDPERAGAADVLFELLERETYAAENERDTTKYRRADVISRNRIQAAQALARMDVPGVRERLLALRDDQDIELREAVLLALEGEDEAREPK